METRGWLRLERWASGMLLVLSAAWVVLHFGDMWTLVNAMWMAIGLLGVLVCVRAELKLRYGVSRASRRRGTGHHS
jgi:hypothetical protein